MISETNRNKLKQLKLLQNIPFEFKDGWTELVYDLAVRIMDYCDRYDKEYPSVNQIKEKFGSLRFYCQGGDSMISSMIGDAENNSANICEICGNPGKILVQDNIYSLWYTACEKHEKENSITLDEWKLKHQIDRS
jgi:hypothetical protein